MGIFLSSNSRVSVTSTAQRYAVQPFSTNLQALVAEINGTIGVG